MPQINRFPLYLVYVIFPVVMLTTREMDYVINRNWIDVIWGVYVVSLVVFLFAKKNITFLLSDTYLIWILFFTFLLIFVKWQLPLFNRGVFNVSYLMELKPLIYIFMAAIIYFVNGKTNNVDYIYMGAILGLLVIAEFCIKSGIQGEFVLPRISGERNYDAVLLLVSFVMLLQHEKKMSRIILVLILAGLFLTFSRTALMVLVFLMIFLTDLPKKTKVFVVFVAIAFVLSSFFIRGLPIDSIERMDRYWMWVTAFQFFDEPLYNILFGFNVGDSIDVVVPKQLQGLWEMQSNGYGITGVYPFHFHAFWIRITFTLGLIVSGLIAVLFLRLLFTRKNFVIKAVSAIVVIEGFTMGVFYVSNVAIPLLLVLFSNANMKASLLRFFYIKQRETNTNEYVP